MNEFYLYIFENIKEIKKILVKEISPLKITYNLILYFI